jgi:carbon storage regulator
MLVLSRKIGECIHIGSSVTVTVLSIQGRQVRLGIEAPTSVPIRRSELPPDPAGPPKARRDAEAATIFLGRP